MYKRQGETLGQDRLHSRHRLPIGNRPQRLQQLGCERLALQGAQQGGGVFPLAAGQLALLRGLLHGAVFPLLQIVLEELDLDRYLLLQVLQAIGLDQLAQLFEPLVGGGPFLFGQLPQALGLCFPAGNRLFQAPQVTGADLQDFFTGCLLYTSDAADE